MSASTNPLAFAFAVKQANKQTVKGEKCVGVALAHTYKNRKKKYTHNLKMFFCAWRKALTFAEKRQDEENGEKAFGVVGVAPKKVQ